MEDLLYEFGYSGGDVGSFPLEAMDTASLLDDGHLVSLKKIQGDVYSINDHQDVDHGLFPDLLPLDHDSDPLSLDWMENVDLSHLLDKPTGVKDETSLVQCGLPIRVQPEDIDLLQSLLQEASEQLTPPDSPAPQVAPEINLDNVTFDHQAGWDILNSPLSPQDVESLLSPSSSLSVTPCGSPSPDTLAPPGSDPPSPSSYDLPTIDLSPILPQQTVSSKTRAKPYERTCKRKAVVRKQPELEEDSDYDFSFRADEKLSKRERKKLQNKNAATKYRQKKKQESTLILNEEKVLEDRNKELKDKVEQLTREISCMKDVLGDIYKGLEAKGKK